MNRRNLLTSGPAAMVLAGAVAGGTAAAAPSPILDAARQIAVLNRQHDEADVPGAPGAALDDLRCNLDQRRNRRRLSSDAA